MISTSSFIPLPYTRDLTEGGIAFALRSLPSSLNQSKAPSYDRLRRLVGSAAVDLAFRRYLSEQDIPFEVKRALPFTDRDRYDVTLGGRRCEIKTFLLSHEDQILQVQRNPELLLRAPALVESDRHAAEGQSPRDLYLFAFLTGRVVTSHQGSKNGSEPEQPRSLLHVMPEAWRRPSSWNPLRKLVLKSDAEETQTIEIGGQDQGRAMCTLGVSLLPRTRTEVGNGFFSLAYLRADSRVPPRIGLHSSVRRETHLIEANDWGDVWVHGVDLWVVGYITREEFSRRAGFLPAGSRVFQYSYTQVKNLAVPVSELRPLSELFERAKLAHAPTTV